MTEGQKLLYEKLMEKLQLDNDTYSCNMKRVDQWKLNQETKKVNEVLKYIRCNNVTGTNNLIKAASIVVAETLGIDLRK